MSLIIIILLAAIVILFLITALFVKKDFTLEKEIVINRPKAEVFNYLKLIRNQEHYSVWVMRDPKSKFPMNVVNLFMNKLVGKYMQQNLQNLKHNLEQ